MSRVAISSGREKEAGYRPCWPGPSLPLAVECVRDGALSETVERQWKKTDAATNA